MGDRFATGGKQRGSDRIPGVHWRMHGSQGFPQNQHRSQLRRSGREDVAAYCSASACEQALHWRSLTARSSSGEAVFDFHPSACLRGFGLCCVFPSELIKFPLIGRKGFVWTMPARECATVPGHAGPDHAPPSKLVDAALALRETKRRCVCLFNFF
jgi:hypothetical protein